MFGAAGIDRVGAGRQGAADAANHGSRRRPSATGDSRSARARAAQGDGRRQAAGARDLSGAVTTAGSRRQARRAPRRPTSGTSSSCRVARSRAAKSPASSPTPTSPRSPRAASPPPARLEGRAAQGQRLPARLDQPRRRTTTWFTCRSPRRSARRSGQGRSARALDARRCAACVRRVTQRPDQAIRLRVEHPVAGHRPRKSDRRPREPRSGARAEPLQSRRAVSDLSESGLTPPSRQTARGGAPTSALM